MNKRRSSVLELTKSQVENILRWASEDPFCIYLDSHGHSDHYGRFEQLLAWGMKSHFELSKETDLQSLFSWHQNNGDWAFGHFNYELKSISEGIHNPHPDPLNWSLASFFNPRHLLYKERGKEKWILESENLEPETLLSLKNPSAKAKSQIQFKSLISRDQYLRDVQSLKAEIQFGNIYEVNYCQSFEAQGSLDPLAYFLTKNEEHQAPFSAFYRHQDQYALSFSPERYLRKEGQKVISQPIKGTAPRYADSSKDSSAKTDLLASEKERAENVMIVDLVRNDLSRTAQNNSVKVDELFGLYSFNAVHQMISTVSSILDEENHSWIDLIEKSFPMGSMTGAPKYSAMQLIDRHEHFNRGLYSGAIGYIDPKANFDFNVVIRSLLYHAGKKLARVGVGSAITIHCQPEAEYEECLLKAEKLVG